MTLDEFIVLDRGALNRVPKYQARRVPYDGFVGFPQLSRNRKPCVHGFLVLLVISNAIDEAYQLFQ
jgi:hypothetical protein